MMDNQHNSNNISTGGDETSSSGISCNSSTDSGVMNQHMLASAVASFLLTRKGLSKEMIGDFIGNLQNPFNQLVLDYFSREINLTNLPVDSALRKVCLIIYPSPLLFMMISSVILPIF